MRRVLGLPGISLSATPRTVAYQALPSMGFSRQEYWSGLPFPSPSNGIICWDQCVESAGWAGFLSTAVRTLGQYSPIVWRVARCILVATKATLFLSFHIFFPP